MPVFQMPAFMSDNYEVELAYTEGVSALQSGDFYPADKHLRRAASGGHVSALYNLGLMHGSGMISPFNIDFAADCFFKAAAAGHPQATQGVGLLEAADRGGFGIDNLVRFAGLWASGGGLNHLLMICGCRYYDVLCRKYGATGDVIAYELNAASHSDDDAVLGFIERTGLERSFYEGGMERLMQGSAADQITDGLNNLYLALKETGTRDPFCRMVRCTVLGHIISKSPYGANAKPLLGVDRFFE